MCLVSSLSLVCLPHNKCEKKNGRGRRGHVRTSAGLVTERRPLFSFISSFSKLSYNVTALYVRPHSSWYPVGNLNLSVLYCNQLVIQNSVTCLSLLILLEAFLFSFLTSITLIILTFICRHKKAVAVNVSSAEKEKKLTQCVLEPVFIFS